MTTLYQEAVTEKDVIIVDFMENWSLNLGRKDMTALQWAKSNLNFDYVLKSDDDVFVDIDALITTIRRQYGKEERDVYFGNLIQQGEVRRSGRLQVPVEEYPAKVYENYCSGGGFVLSRTLIRKMIPHFNWEHPLRIEDAYIGWLVARAGGRAEAVKGFEMFKDKCTYTNTLVVTHPASQQCKEKLQKILLDKKKHFS